MAKRYLEDDIKMHVDFDEPIVLDLGSSDDSREAFDLFVKTVHVITSDIYDTSTRARLIKVCKEYYRGNRKESVFIDEFNTAYKPDQALAWYMRGSCLNRLLARAFVERDIGVLVDMYSFIVDINRQIGQQSIRQPTPLRVYRGQILSQEQFSLLETSVGQIVTMQCLLSAQTSREETQQLLQTIQPNDPALKRVLFEIDTSNNYATVDGATSKTVLFELGAKFRLVEVTETTVRLSHDSSDAMNKNDLAHESPTIIRGILISLKSGPNAGVKYFKKILSNSSPTDFALRSSAFGQLGILQQKLGDRDGATNMYAQSLQQGEMQFGLYRFYLDQAAHYHADVLGDWEKARAIWTSELNTQQSAPSNKDKGRTYENLARAALNTEQYPDAIEYITLAMACFPDDHSHRSVLQQQLDLATSRRSEQTAQ